MVLDPWATIRYLGAVFSHLVRLTAGVVLAASALACGPTLPAEAEWPPQAKKWYDRAEASYRSGDIDDAEVSLESALKLLPDEPKVKLLGAQVALATLEYDRAVQLLKGLQGNDAMTLRSRAYWYDGKLDKAADELDRLLKDPEVRDPWATEVAKLARRGPGGKPFEISGALLGVTEMPRVGSTALIVPLEVNGEPALAMVATDYAEAVIDSSSGKEASWVSLRIGDGFEVSNVPAMARDLSRISRQVNAPIKMLIGVNLLRHLHPTLDFGGAQFVVRSFEPPAPPNATSVGVAYARGGGMLVRAAFGEEETALPASFLVNTSMLHPLALDKPAWKRAGVKFESLERTADSSLRFGTLPMFRLGGMAVPGVAGVFGAPIAELAKGINMELDGLLGSGFLAAFRVTLVNGGRRMWLEDLPPGALEWLPSPDDIASLPSPDAGEPALAPLTPPPGIGAN